MHRDPKTRQMTALLMAAVMMFTSLPLGGLSAGMVTTEQMLDENRAKAASAIDATDQRSRIQDFLTREDVQREMMALGVTASEAKARVAAMTDQEVAELSGHLDELPAGGFGVGTVLIFLSVAFGAAVLIDALGLIDIFPFVCGRGPCGEQLQANAEQQSETIPNDDFVYQNRRPVYENDRVGRYDRDNRRRFRQDDRRFEPDNRRSRDPNGFEPEPQLPQRNYFEERFGSRQVR